MRADLMAQFIDAIRSGRPKTSGPSIRPGGPIGHAFGDSCDPPVAPIQGDGHDDQAGRCAGGSEG